MAFNAALEGPSVTGAYRFEITPANDGAGDTVIDVTARLFFRADIKEIGVAPLTSMFLFADNNRSDFDDYREQVHDSSGLLMDFQDGTTLWRPLNNPPVLANSYLWADKLRSFGLYQRERDFTDYEDTSAQYQRRPSTRIEPLGDWGEGHVRLIEVPTKLEADDNIGVFWIPAKPVKAGDNLEMKYRMHWGDLPPDPKGPLAYVVETRTGQGGVSGVAHAESLRKFVIDFNGGPLANWNPTTPPAIVATVDGATLKGSTIERIAQNGMWRLVLDVETHGTDLVELKALLTGQGKPLTETWIYQWRAAS
jgi:glucans biosynthesis protein